MERWTYQCLTIGLVILPLHIITCATLLSCDVAYSKAAYSFYSGSDSAYTCNDMIYIAHGQGCYKKCNSITEYYNIFGYRQCTNGVCPVPPPGGHLEFPSYQCVDEAHVHCDALYPYRSIDGQCNNLKYPDWGKAETAQPRLLPNAYDDGQGSPKTRGCFGKLPSARLISEIVHKAGSTMKFDNKLTYMLMQFGQFLAHDATLVKQATNSTGGALKCCDEDVDDPGCNSIEVPIDDPHFNSTCMVFARSKSKVDCHGIFQQINSHSSPFDLSMIYSANIEEARSLRTLQGGKLTSLDNKLPIDENDKTCDLSRPVKVPEHYCPHSGDARVNENPGLSSIHTILMREHNRLAELLAMVNPHWDDEKLYQEARKINIAQWQNIIYQEYLPLLINPYLMRKFKLNIRPSGYQDTYNCYVDPSITNEFAAAIFRYGHSMIHSNISMMGYSHEHQMEPETLVKHYFKPELYLSHGGKGLEYILMWTSFTKSPRLDNEMEKSVQAFLFKDKDGMALDLAALNIQRGRDHGLPGYNAYRQMCGLSRVQHFGTYAGGLVHHDSKVANMMSEAYDCPDDIDLFTGAISEKRVKGAILGPTAQCIHAIQYKRLRDGDRFFFTRKDPVVGFTQEQLNSIKKVKLSTLLCLNTHADKLQPNVFKQPIKHARHSNNEMKPCSVLKECQVNIDLWQTNI